MHFIYNSNNVTITLNSLSSTHTHTHHITSHHKQTVPHAVPIHVTLHESWNFNKYTSFDLAEWKTFGPAGGHILSHSIQWSCLPPSGLSHCPYSNLLTYTNTNTLWQDSRGLWGGLVCEFDGSQTVQHLLPLKAWALRSTWRACCGGLSLPLFISIFFFFSIFFIIST